MHNQRAHSLWGSLWARSVCIFFLFGVFLCNDTIVGDFYKSVLACCTDANHSIYWATSDCTRLAPGAPSLHDVTERRCSFLMPTRSFCSETHQSARCLIGSERWESIAICTLAPKSSLWTRHSRHITCSLPGVASHQRLSAPDETIINANISILSQRQQTYTCMVFY